MNDIPDSHPIRQFVIETGSIKDGFQRACEHIAQLEEENKRLRALSVPGVGAIMPVHLLKWAKGVRQVQESDYSFKVTAQERDLANAIIDALLESESEG